jgi:hypothetical protein
VKPGASLLAVFGAVAGAVLSACGGGAQPAAPRAAPTLINSPPLAKLSDEQLHSLSMRCEKYAPDKTTRGPYDAAYCEAAISAWADAPIQMLPFKQGGSTPQSSAPPQ